MISNLFSAAILLVCLLTAAAADEDDMTIAVGGSSSMWTSFLNLCDTMAPYMGVVCFLAPLPTIRQVARDKTVGNLPLLPYSSMVSNSFVWVMYGLLKKAPSVLYSNAIGVTLGAYYFYTFTQFCGPMASNLPGTVSQHLRGASAIILFNVFLAGWMSKESASEIIGKEGVLFCIILFASPLAALKHVIVSKSAASIPLPFTVACLFNCAAWSVVGIWQMQDFNIYFPNLMGLSCAIAQMGLKVVYGDRAKAAELPK
jgi:solute carrier family 50 protein (sugar transporter)